MSYKLSEKEQAAVSALRPEQRLEHFVKRVADWEEIWSLKAPSDWVMAGTESGARVFPIWPHPNYAKTCVCNQWSDSSPEAISLEHFMNAWVPGLTKDGVKVAVFPTPNSGGAVTEPTALKELLEKELENY